jgi:hypothetical protein
VALPAAPVLENRVRVVPGIGCPCGSFTVPVMDAPDCALTTALEIVRMRSKYSEDLVIMHFQRSHLYFQRAQSRTKCSAKVGQDRK